MGKKRTNWQAAHVPSDLHSRGPQPAGSCAKRFPVDGHQTSADGGRERSRGRMDRALTYNFGFLPPNKSLRRPEMALLSEPLSAKRMKMASNGTKTKAPNENTADNGSVEWRCVNYVRVLSAEMVQHCGWHGQPPALPAVPLRPRGSLQRPDRGSRLAQTELPAAAEIESLPSMMQTRSFIGTRANAVSCGAAAGLIWE